MDILEFLSYGFIRRAMTAGSFIAVLCSVLGVLLVLRRLSLMGDGLAHVTFGSVALGLAMKVYPLYVSIPVVMISSVGILKMIERAGIYGDAAIGIVSSLGIAVGVVIASASGGLNVDILSYLFGNILSIGDAEVYISMFLAALVLLTIFFYFDEIFSMTFDEEFAKASGINVNRINLILAVLTSVTVVLTMRLVGIMLTSALLILPAVTAFQIGRGFKHTLFIAAASGVTSVITGIFVSFCLDLPAGASIVLINFALFFAAFSLRRFNVFHG
ncbi:MAG: metal ABC transporter permease [Nitrospirae bacterium]|nr:MAG: metal ABC transporter permease [Nitrospirota bacterium]